MRETDECDIAILNHLQRDLRITTEELAEHVGLSASSVSRRIKRLRQEGIIESEIAVLSPKALGRRLTAVVEVELEREQPDLLDHFKKWILDAHEVMQCYYVTGSADFILIVTVRDIDEYESFSRRFFTEHTNIRRFHTNIVLDRVKAGLAVPLG